MLLYKAVFVNQGLLKNKSASMSGELRVIKDYAVPNLTLRHR